MKSINKSVRFSPYSQMIVTNYPSKEDIKEKWYNGSDKDCFKRAFAHDIANCSKMLSANARLRKPLTALTEDEMIMCLGLESVISRDIAKHVVSTRKLHIERILNEQTRQKRSGSYDENRFAKISYRSSEESRVRSHKIGVRLMALDKC